MISSDNHTPMADTIITNTPDRGTRDDSSGAVGLVVALIILLAILVAGFVWYRHGAGIPNTGGGGTNINVSVPTPGGGGATGGTTGGASTGGTGGTGATQ